MDMDFSYYIFVLVAIIVGVIVIKKIASCLIKTAVLLIMVAALLYIYFTYFSAGV